MKDKDENKDEVTRTVKLVPHFVYSNFDNKIIDHIYLTEEQAYQLNKISKRNGVAAQDIVFLRK